MRDFDASGARDRQRQPFYFFKGRVALYAILRAMGVRQGDEVMLPAFTCVVVPNAVRYLGAVPVFVDVDENTFNIDHGRIEEKITKRTKAIIAQHTFGIPAEMDGVNSVAKKAGLYVIEDACHALGSRYRGKDIGTLGDAAFFSSQWSKPVTTGLGGWAAVNDKLVGKRLEKDYDAFPYPDVKDSLALRAQYLLHSWLFRPSLFWTLQGLYRSVSKTGFMPGSSSRAELECRMPEKYALRMAPWQERLLALKLEGASSLIEHRKAIARVYEKALSRFRAGARLPSHYDPVYLRYPVFVKDKGRALEKARRLRVELGDWFTSPVHPNMTFWERAGYRKGSCPVAEELCGKTVNLPTHAGINGSEAARAIDTVSEHLA